MALDPSHPSTDPRSLYSDPGTLYNQPINPYVPPAPPPQQSNAPDITPNTTTTPSVTTPAVGIAPSSGGESYQRQQAQQLAIRVSGSNIPTQNTFRPNVGRGGNPADIVVGNVVYKSLQMPKLLRGGEWQLSVMTNLIASAFLILAIMGWNWRMLPGALFFGGPVQWLLRMMAQRDPRRWQKYLLSIRKPLILYAGGKPSEDAPIPQIMPKPSLFVH